MSVLLGPSESVLKLTVHDADDVIDNDPKEPKSIKKKAATSTKKKAAAKNTKTKKKSSQKEEVKTEKKTKTKSKTKKTEKENDTKKEEKSKVKKSKKKTASRKKAKKETKNTKKNTNKAIKKAAKKTTKKKSTTKSATPKDAKDTTSGKASDDEIALDLPNQTPVVPSPVPKRKTAKQPVALAKEKPKKTCETEKILGDEKNDDTLKQSFASSRPTLPHIKREPLGHLLVEKLLREAGFTGGISTDDEVLHRFSTDESIFAIRPQVVIQPKSKSDLETAVRIVAVHTQKFPSLSLTPRAAGTGLSGGSLTDSVVVDVAAHLNKIDEPQPKTDGVYIQCEPGAMFRDVEKKLKPHNAYLPGRPASRDICTIGGAIANNAAGPDSLHYGHMAESVVALDVVLLDGNTYRVEPVTYKKLEKLMKKEHEYGRIAREVFTLIEEHETDILKARPKTKKNTAGYPLWDVLSTTMSEFKNGNGTFDLTRLISGSQGSIGIIVSIHLKAEYVSKKTTLITVPIFKLEDAACVITEALKFDPINVEIFDACSFDLALRNPSFFKERLAGTDYYKVMFAMYTTFHIRYRRRMPEFTLLITLDSEKGDAPRPESVAKEIALASKQKVRVVKNEYEEEMLWQVRRASYSLAKLMGGDRRPAAFLEDMTVPPEHVSEFLIEIKELMRKYCVMAAIHGHGGNGHFHFYPLLDFTNTATPKLIEKMSEEFFNTAIKYDGNICGEHNDGIIRTPHLNKIFKKDTIALFEQLESIFDPDDIFNPGKKVRPRFDIKESIRKTN